MFIAYLTNSFVGRGGLVCFEILNHRVLGASIRFGRRLECDTWHSVLSAGERLISSSGRPKGQSGRGLEVGGNSSLGNLELLF